jgi:thioesterase domain-containing protein
MTFDTATRGTVLATAATDPLDAGHAFFLGGVGGDDPEFAELARRLRPHLRLVPVDYPDAGARGAVLSSMAATAAVVTADIERLQPRGGIALVGYSFGGSLALEVANQLTRAGRTVDLLCPLDAPFRMDELRGLFEKLRLATAPRQAMKKVVEAAALSEVTLRLVTNAASPDVVGGARANPVRRALLTHLRTKALAGWRPEGCDAPGLLVSTGVLGAENRARWLSLCPGLACVEIGGEHERLLQGASLDRVVEALAGAVRRRAAR